MPVIVVATLTPKPGRLQDVLDAFAAVAPKVHAEQGCELYALHQDDAGLVVIERWTTAADLQAHAIGAPMQELIERRGDALEEPPAVRSLQNLPFGDPAKATIQ